jgi:hypothetical protein
MLDLDGGSGSCEFYLYFCFVLFCFVLFCFVLFCFVLFAFVHYQIVNYEIVDSGCAACRESHNVSGEYNKVVNAYDLYTRRVLKSIQYDSTRIFNK